MTDESIMPFGKYKGIFMANVPAGYLLWFYRGVARQVHTAPVLDYIRENLDIIEKEVNNGI